MSPDPTHFRHGMPFGAEVDEGGTTFRLWAPSARVVALCIEGRDPLPGEATPRGLWSWHAEGAGHGDRYRFLVDGVRSVPDPASRWQPEGVHGPSVVVDPRRFDWGAGEATWTGVPWPEAVVYELHVGAFSPEGTYAGVVDRLDHLVALGVRAVELMPLAACPGRRNWGYDGVYPFAPFSAYGTPDDLKRLVREAHARGLMVLVDVVYNHFGPEGNYLHDYAKPFFTDRCKTPWGAAIDYRNDIVRAFAIHNALYWIVEMRCDGLRLDAVHEIRAGGSPHVLVALAAEVRAHAGGRHVHLVLENDDNRAEWLEGVVRFDAQWNDDFHHALHVIVTGEADGYYGDHADAPVARLGRCLASGFDYQGEPSPHRSGRPRGEPSGHLPASAFVGFLQNHDQIGNRALGERIGALASEEAIHAAAAVLLLAPQVPLLFMGEEWGATSPFFFFCDFEGELAELVREGRRREFESFPAFRDPEARARIPDPGAEATFAASKLRWEELAEPRHRASLERYRELLALRRDLIVARLEGFGRGAMLARGTLLEVDWAGLSLVANLGAQPVRDSGPPRRRLVYATNPREPGMLPPWHVAWYLEP
jgi:maltooligosyltrehalose trehalohydrolase